MRRTAFLWISIAALSTHACIFSLGPIAMSPGAGGKHGAPAPHAPAHGYRHHHPADGMELRFDAELGVYTVVDLPRHYYLDGQYLRWSGGRWSASTHLDGPWKTRAAKRVPPGLQKKSGHW